MKFLRVIIILIISFLLLFTLLLISAFDFVTSVIPGWHTTIYSPLQIALYITVPWLIFAICCYLIAKRNNRRISAVRIRTYLLLSLTFPLLSLYFTITGPSGTPFDSMTPIILWFSFIAFFTGQLYFLSTMIEIGRKQTL